jgi:hypothetical protein
MYAFDVKGTADKVYIPKDDAIWVGLATELMMRACGDGESTTFGWHLIQ